MKTHKKCGRCKEVKLREDFKQRQKHLPALHSRCNDCRKIEQRLYWKSLKKDRDRYYEYRMKSNRKALSYRKRRAENGNPLYPSLVMRYEAIMKLV